MTGENFDGKKAAAMGLVNEAVPRKKLRARVEKLARTLLEKNQTVLRGAKLAMKRTKYMDWEVSADYLYAKMAEALYLGGADNRKNAMKAFLDDKTFKPGLEHYKGTR
jgi:trans-feruloyl-CoA hydratase/vanillin synthase